MNNQSVRERALGEMLRLFGASTGGTATPSQEHAFYGLASFLDTAVPRPLLVINGYAGTGKTSLMRAFCDYCSLHGLSVQLMAPTGRAAKVLSVATGREANTIHRAIYNYQSGAAELREAGEEPPAFLYVVDEASMIGDNRSDSARYGRRNVLDDLMEYVYDRQRSRLLLLGDPAQLPPIGLSSSPALQDSVAERYRLTRGVCELTDVVRQGEHSAMLRNASRLRQAIAQGGPFRGLPELEYSDTAGGPCDVVRVDNEDLPDALQECYNQYGLDETIMLVQANWMASDNNSYVKGTVLGHDSALCVGDRLLVTRNNYHWLREKWRRLIANGEIMEVVSIYGHADAGGLHFADVRLRPVQDRQLEFDARVALDLLYPTRYGQKRVSEADIRTRQDALALQGDEESANALEVRHAYVVTCHKAQGGQWKAVFVNLACDWSKDPNVNPLRWYYTALTRATERLYLVNYHPERMTAY